VKHGRADAAEAEAVVRRAAEGTRLYGHIRSQQASRKPHELESELARVRTRLANVSASAKGGVRSHVDHVAETVEVEVNQEHEREVREALRAEDFSEALRVNVVDFRTGGMGEACTNMDACTPLRGGVRLQNPAESGYCTTGFSAVSKVDSVRYMLTAGHCTKLTGNYRHNNASIGPVWRTVGPNSTGDFGMVRVDSTATWNPVARVFVNSSAGAYPTTHDPDYYISRVASASYELGTGNYVCHTGRTWGTGCGQINLYNATAPNGAGGMGRVDYCSAPGDSGGPVFVSHTAYGLHVDSDNRDLHCGDNAYFQGVIEAADSMNVRVLTVNY
jgi:hypothetical protein